MVWLWTPWRSGNDHAPTQQAHPRQGRCSLAQDIVLKTSRGTRRPCVPVLPAELAALTRGRGRQPMSKRPPWLRLEAQAFARIVQTAPFLA